MLVVEDDLDFIDGLKPRLEAMGAAEVLIAQSRDAAYGILGNLKARMIDIIVLDLRLPSAPAVFDHSPDHGEAVFHRALDVAPGTPIFLLTGSSFEQFARKLLRKARQEDVFGDGQTISTIEVFQKTDLPEFLDHMKGMCTRIRATNSIDLNTGIHPLELSRLERRTIRIFTKRQHGTTCTVSSLSGGLSASRVLRARSIVSSYMQRLQVMKSCNVEHRLNTIKNRENGIVENSLYSVSRMRPTKRQCSLFAIYGLFPKLNIAPSHRVSAMTTPFRALPPA